MIDKVHSSTTFIKYQAEKDIDMNKEGILKSLRYNPFVDEKIKAGYDIADIFYEFHIAAIKFDDCELKRENLIASDCKIDAKLLEIMDEFEKEDCGNSENVCVVMHDFKKVEKNFHDLIRSIYKQRPISFELPEITEKLLAKQAAIDMPETFGGFFYFLAIEDEKPVLYVGVFSRMNPDLDRLCIVDEQSYRWIEDGSYCEKLSDVFK